jgi:phage gp36-like protein
MADYEAWIARTGKAWTTFADAATDFAASYLMRYRDFFTAWESAPPDAVAKAVATIAVKDLAQASGNLAPGDLEESPWEREYKRALSWLRDVSSGAAELCVDWPGSQEPSGHRAYISTRKAGEL